MTREHSKGDHFGILLLLGAAHDVCTTFHADLSTVVRTFDETSEISLNYSPILTADLLPGLFQALCVFSSPANPLFFKKVVVFFLFTS